MHKAGNNKNIICSALEGKQEKKKTLQVWNTKEANETECTKKEITPNVKHGK